MFGTIKIMQVETIVMRTIRNRPKKKRRARKMRWRNRRNKRKRKRRKKIRIRIARRMMSSRNLRKLKRPSRS